MTPGEAWTQTAIPVVYRRRKAKDVLLRAPYMPDMRHLLAGLGRKRPRWWKTQQCWILPSSWLSRVIALMLELHGRTYLMQWHYKSEKCAPACWNAKGFDCECSCLGANHGSRDEAGWHVISDVCATRQCDATLACSLIEAKERG